MTLTPLFTLDFRERETITGSVEHIVARPDLYQILLRQIPKEKIHMNKKVLSFMQNNDGVMIRCADNQTHHGDILVGADGAYSAVRQHLYKDLKVKKLLPKSDDVPLPFNCVCLVGQTEVLDPEEFPGMKLERSHFHSILGSDEYSFLNNETLKTHDSFRNSEWGPEAVEAMCKEVRHFKLPIGKDGTTVAIGDLMDRTPKDLISKVVLEEKVFDTWYDRRPVLLGDACHKLNPAAGAGALSAIQDAVTLANWICALQTKKVPELEMAFKEYKAERFPVIKEAFATRQLFKSMGAKNFIAKMARLLFKHMPPWLMRQVIIKACRARPQVSFLPLVQDLGTVKPANQPSLEKTLAIHEKRRAEKVGPEAIVAA
ncbi:hypothetical protein BG003_005736 [Podila horticola]|nr:hypothetical protein BG003_005736 [Podila horticola]